MAQAEPMQRPQPVDELCTLTANTRLTDTLYDMELEAPEIARAILPGQFVHLKVPGMEGHILRRPFSVREADAPAGLVRILYQVVGAGSAHMTTLEPGCTLDVMGPMGNGWKLPEPADRVLFVLGGVGAAPLFMFGQQVLAAGAQLDVCMGAQTAESLVMKPHYQALLGDEPFCATDDGSYGHAGFVTGLAEKLLDAYDYDLVCCCGPTPLMRAVARLAEQAGTPCQVSMEKRMACGIGACLSCVVETRYGKARSCVDGPVFDARKVVW